MKLAWHLPALLGAAGLAFLITGEPAWADAELSHLTLPQAVQLLRAGNRDLGLAEAAVTAASADVDVAGTRPNPQLAVSTTQIGAPGSNTGGLWQRPYDTAVEWDQPLERGGKRGLRLAAARAGLKAAGSDRDAVWRDQLNALYGAYYGLLAAQQKLTLSQEMAAAYQRSVDAAARRLHAGDIAAADLARLQVDAARSQNDASQAASNVAQARITLARLLAREASAEQLVVVDQWPAIESLGGTDLKELADRQPDVLAAKARVESARQTVDLARSQQTRDVTVSVQYEHEPPLFNSALGLGVSIPIMLGDDHRGEIRRAEADLTTAQLTLEDVRSQEVSQLATAQDALRLSADVLGRFRGDVRSNAESAATAAEFAYSHGASGLMDLLDARRTLRAVQSDALDAEATYAVNLATWKILVAPESATTLSGAATQ